MLDRIRTRWLYLALALCWAATAVLTAAGDILLIPAWLGMFTVAYAIGKRHATRQTTKAADRERP